MGLKFIKKFKDDKLKIDAYMKKAKGEYKLSPLAGELFAIDAEEVMIEKPKEQKFSIYGEY